LKESSKLETGRLLEGGMVYNVKNEGAKRIERTEREGERE